MIGFLRQQSANFYLFNKYPITKQFIKFCLVGFTNLTIDIFIYWLLTRALGLYYLVAGVISFVVAVSWSFFMNRRWTFRHNGSDTASQYVKFFVVNVIVMILNLSSLYIFVEWFDFYDLAVKLVAAVIMAFINFGLNKFWTFKKLAIASRLASEEIGSKKRWRVMALIFLFSIS